jgi:Tfp pilus assembly protein PilF
MMEIRRRWPQVFARWTIQYAISQPNELEDALAGDGHWSLVYFDDAAFVYVRNDGANAELGRRLAYHELLPPFAATPQGEGVRRALAEAERAVHAAPSSALAHILRGRVRGMLHDLDGFEEDMKTAQTLGPARPEPWQRLGLLALARRQLSEAKRNLGRAVSLSPSDESLRVGLATAYLASGDDAAARATLQSLVRPDRTLEQMLATIRRGAPGAASLP